MPKVRDRPLSWRAQLAMHPFAQIKADHFLRALLDHEAADSRKLWGLAGEFGVSRATLCKAAGGQRVQFLPSGAGPPASREAARLGWL